MDFHEILIGFGNILIKFSWTFINFDGNPSILIKIHSIFNEVCWILMDFDEIELQFDKILIDFGSILMGFAKF